MDERDFTIELEIYLGKVADVTSIVGAGKFAKVFQHIARQRVSYPFIIIDESGGQASEHLTGTTGIARGDYILWALSKNDERECLKLWSAVRKNLQKFGPAPMNGEYDGGGKYVDGTGTMVHEVSLDTNWRDRGFFIPQDASQDTIYYAASRYSIWHAVPLEVV